MRCTEYDMKSATLGDCAAGGRSSCTYPFASPPGRLPTRQIADGKAGEGLVAYTGAELCRGRNDVST